MGIVYFVTGVVVGFAAGILIGRRNKNKVEQAVAEAERLKRKIDNMR